VCAGATPLAVTDCLNYGNPEKPETYYVFERSVDGMSDACKAFGTPVISGNVSLYNETGGVDIYPTPVVGMVGVIADRQHITTSAFATSGARIVLLGDLYAPLKDGLGGSEYLGMKEPQAKLRYELPAFALATEQAVQATCLSAIHANLIEAAHDVSDGGLIVALVEGALTGGKSGFATLDLGGASEERSAAPLTLLQQASLLFGESPSRIALCVAPSVMPALRAVASANGCLLWDLGEVIDEPEITVQFGQTSLLTVSLDEAQTAWRGAIAKWMA